MKETAFDDHAALTFIFMASDHLSDKTAIFKKLKAKSENKVDDLSSIYMYMVGLSCVSLFHILT